MEEVGGTVAGVVVVLDGGGVVEVAVGVLVVEVGGVGFTVVVGVDVGGVVVPMGVDVGVEVGGTVVVEIGVVMPILPSKA